MNVTADAVSLQETKVFRSFSKSHNQQHTRRTLAAEETAGNYSPSETEAAGYVWECGLIAEPMLFYRPQVNGWFVFISTQLTHAHR